MRVSSSASLGAQRARVVARGELDELAHAQRRRQRDLLQHHADLAAASTSSGERPMSRDRRPRPAAANRATARSPSTCRRRSARARRAARRGARRVHAGERDGLAVALVHAARARRDGSRSPFVALARPSAGVAGVRRTPRIPAAVQDLADEREAHEIVIAREQHGERDARISGNLIAQCNGTFADAAPASADDDRQMREIEPVRRVREVAARPGSRSRQKSSAAPMSRSSSTRSTTT